MTPPFPDNHIGHRLDNFQQVFHHLLHLLSFVCFVQRLQRGCRRRWRRSAGAATIFVFVYYERGVLKCSSPRGFQKLGRLLPRPPFRLACLDRSPFRRTGPREANRHRRGPQVSMCRLLLLLPPLIINVSIVSLFSRRCFGGKRCLGSTNLPRCLHPGALWPPSGRPLL